MPALRVYRVVDPESRVGYVQAENAADLADTMNRFRWDYPLSECQWAPASDEQVMTAIRFQIPIWI